ncbi:unnamed protein product [Amoebophrya sp. A25]|nr:unnamed protein product [Amoebophrya sp. A25]|eukprot:GSA25T00009163001.1
MPGVPSLPSFEGSEPSQLDVYSIPIPRPQGKEAKCQTDRIQLRNMRIQAQDQKSIECQTMDFNPESFNPENDLQKPGGANSPWLVNVRLQSDVPGLDATLLQFLKKAVKTTLAELESSEVEQPAFANYEPRWEEEGGEDVRVIHLLNGPTNTGAPAASCSVLDLAWNCTGNIIAASYGNLNTLGWCEYNSVVHVWNIFSRHQAKNTASDAAAGSQGRSPDVKIEVQGEVLSLAFHPRLPSILAGGSYNGELILWDTSQTASDPQIAMSSIDDYFHREAIHEVSWIEQEKKFLLATISGDGRILLWDITDNLEFPCRGFSILQKKRTVGGRALAFSPFDSSLFVLGSETGALIRGMCPQVVADSSSVSLTGADASKWKTSAKRFLDAVPASSRMNIRHHVEAYVQKSVVEKDQGITAQTIFRSKPDANLLFPQPKTTDLEPHPGPITAARFSPFHRKMLLSAGLDGGVKLFDILQQRPLYVFYPTAAAASGHGGNNLISGVNTASSSVALADVAWSHARPLVFAVAPEAGGAILVYDLMRSKHQAVVSVPCRKATRVRFNPTQRGLLAAGNVDGELRIFGLPWSLSCPSKTAETTLLNRLMSGK